VTAIWWPPAEGRRCSGTPEPEELSGRLPRRSVHG
jgi:hypothetical protein